MATKKKTSKKTAGTTKPATKTPVVPAVVKNLGNIGVNLRDVSGIPSGLADAQTKLAASIDRFAVRVANSFTSSVKAAARDEAKAKRDAAKVERDKAKAEKTAAREKVKTERAAIKAKKRTDKIAALRAQISDLEKS